MCLQKAAIGGKHGDKAAQNASEAFRALRVILLQDLPLYFRDFADLPIFKSRVLRDHWSAFLRWSQLIWKYNDECKELGAGNTALHTFDDGGVAIFKGMPIAPRDAPTPEGFKKVSIAGSDLLCYLEKVLYQLFFNRP